MATSTLQTRYNDYLAFLQAWVPAHALGARFFLTGQAAPRPPLPYVGVTPISAVEMMGPLERRITPQGKEVWRSQLEITTELYAFTDSETRYDGALNAWAMLQELKTSLRYPAVYDSLTAIVFRLTGEGDVVNVSQLLNTTFEPQASASVTFSTVIETEDIDNGAIESVNALGTIISPDGSTVPITISVTKT
jgi:hypothetical protein